MGGSLDQLLRQPEYTGENRCSICTLTNIVIAMFIGTIISSKSKLIGLISMVISFIAIYYRGYLVPGTPRITKKYFPHEVLQWIGKDPVATNVQSGLGNGDLERIPNTIENTDSSTTDLSSPDQYFLEQNIAEICSDGRGESPCGVGFA